MKESVPLQKLLVILPSNLGDVIMATPVLEGLKRKYKRSFVAFLVEDGFEAGLILNPYCDSIIKFRRREIRNALVSSHWQDGRILLERAINDVSARSFDIVINLSQPVHVSLLTALIGGKTVMGQKYLREGNHCVEDSWSQYLFAIPYYRMANNLHATDVYRRIAGVKSHFGGCELVVSDAEKSWATGFLAGHGIGAGDKIAVFQPGAALPSKCWPAERFVALEATGRRRMEGMRYRRWRRGRCGRRNCRANRCFGNMRSWANFVSTVCCALVACACLRHRRYGPDARVRGTTGQNLRDFRINQSG